MKLIIFLFTSFLAPIFILLTPQEVLADTPCCPAQYSNDGIVCINDTGTYREPIPAWCKENEVCDTSTNPPYCRQTTKAQEIFGRIIPPPAIGNLGPGSAGVSNVLSKIIQLIYSAASIIFVFMVIISAVQWILSGGDKEAVSNARKRLTWAIIGIIVLALAFVFIKAIGQITGFEFFVGQNTQTPGASVSEGTPLK
ncbi:MAG: pilin [Candidatus Daviesbacteria bacterium]